MQTTTDAAPDTAADAATGATSRAAAADEAPRRHGARPSARRRAARQRAQDEPDAAPGAASMAPAAAAAAPAAVDAAAAVWLPPLAVPRAVVRALTDDAVYAVLCRDCQALRCAGWDAGRDSLKLTRAFCQRCRAVLGVHARYRCGRCGRPRPVSALGRAAPGCACKTEAAPARCIDSQYATATDATATETDTRPAGAVRG